jgi:hypothetical protein
MGKGRWRLITTGGLKKEGKNGPCVFLLIKYLDQSGLDFMLQLRNFSEHFHAKSMVKILLYKGMK